MSITAISTANAGIMLTLGGKNIWVDAVHLEAAGGFSSVTEEMLETMLETPEWKPDLCLFTHAHSDHFSRQGMKRVLEFYPDTQIFIEGHKGLNNQTELKQPVEQFTVDDLKIAFFKTIHSDKRYEKTPHYSILLECGNERVLFPGDVHVSTEEVFGFLARELGVDSELSLAFLNFPWVALTLGRTGVEKLHAKHVVFFHVPFEGQDAWGYRNGVIKAVNRYKGENDWRFIEKPFQVENFDD